MSTTVGETLVTAAEIANELARVHKQIGSLQEEADRGGMFQGVSPSWKARYVRALRALAAARTRAQELSLDLDVARRREATALAELRFQARLEKVVRP